MVFRTLIVNALQRVWNYCLPICQIKHIPHFYFNNKRSQKQSANIIKVSHFTCTSLSH